MNTTATVIPTPTKNRCLAKLKKLVARFNNASQEIEHWSANRLAHTLAMDAAQARVMGSAVEVFHGQDLWLDLNTIKGSDREEELRYLELTGALRFHPHAPHLAQFKTPLRRRD